MALLKSPKFSKHFEQCFKFVVCRRWKNQQRRIKEENLSVCSRAIDYFDELYKPLFQEHWPSIRVALLSPAKRGIVLNNFGDKEKEVQNLKLLGVLNVRKLFLEQQRCTQVSNSTSQMNKKLIPGYTFENNKDNDIREQKQQEDGCVPYSEAHSAQSSIAKHSSSDVPALAFKDVADDHNDDIQREHEPFDPTQDMSLEENLKSADYDLSRLIIPTSSGSMMGASLYEFVPATKLMGMDNFTLESPHYAEYKDAIQFSLDIKKETSVNFPENLDIYAFGRGNCTSFPLPRTGKMNVLGYHEFDLSFLTLILALDVKPEDRVLDMCSFLVDTAILIAQTLTPKIFVSNTTREGNASATFSSLKDYFPDIFEEDSNIIVTATNPFKITDTLSYNKILLGVPNLLDRKSMTNEENNIFHPMRIKERLNLPQLQKDLLRKALELVDEGGTVVYFTESLSPIHNEGVVLAVLSDMWETTGCRFVVKDMADSLSPLHQFLKITNSEKCGHIVLPFLPNNYGPLYFCKIVKTFHNLHDNTEQNSINK